MGQDFDDYRPGEACPACQAEAGRPVFHERPVLIVFGSSPQWPCSGRDGALGPHLCTRCGSCGHSWVRPVTLPA